MTCSTVWPARRSCSTRRLMSTMRLLYSRGLPGAGVGGDTKARLRTAGWRSARGWEPYWLADDLDESRPKTATLLGVPTKT